MKLVPATGYVIIKPKLVVKKDRTTLIGLKNAVDNGELVFQVISAPNKDQIGKVIISSHPLNPHEINTMGNVIPEESIVAYIEVDETEEVIELPTE